MTYAEVKLWGKRIGAVSFDRKRGTGASFEYDRDFINHASGIEPAPIRMKRTQGIYSFPESSEQTFRGLPGLLVDSLPDKFGTGLMNRWLIENNHNPEETNTVERLLYMSDRGMGALTFEPAKNIGDGQVPSMLNIDDLAGLADAVLKREETLRTALLNEKSSHTALDLIRVGTSAGGARAKALVAEGPNAEMWPGHIIYKQAHRYWLLKFDGIGNNSDRESSDPPGMTIVEYIYALIARQAGIRIPETRLLETGELRHFMIERFDRVSRGEQPDKLHYSSWCGIDHAHRDWPGAYSYEQLALVCRRIGLPHEDMEELFRRAVYNVVGVNHDDHTKNFGFLMNRLGEWRLSPAFDLTYACDPGGRWTKGHQSTLSGKNSDHKVSDLMAFAEHCDLTNRDAKIIIDRVRNAFTDWPTLSAEYSVPRHTRETITVMQNEIAKGLDA